MKAEQVNAVLDRLAQILGSSSTEVVSAYTRGFFIDGVVHLILGILGLGLAIAGAVVAWRGLGIWRFLEKLEPQPRWGERKEEEDGRICSTAMIVIGVIMVIFGVVCACCSITSAPTEILAPESLAIEHLINQVAP